jgi:2,3,4,5-tetrahydropyridine-2-carboxylate N-succinyltransferase
MTDDLLDQIDELYERDPDSLGDAARESFDEFLQHLETGEIRAARPHSDRWRVNASVKRGILLGFRLGSNEAYDDVQPFQYRDRETYPPQTLPLNERNIRLVPGGSAVRAGAYVGNDVTVMPPAYINVGAYVDERSMVDSHALVGSCAQVGSDVHLSAGAQLGGVLEPVGQAPVIVEDDALVGANTGLFEGVRVREGAVIGTGVNLTASTPVYDLVREEVLRATDDHPLVIPKNAVVIAGSRSADSDFAEAHGLQMSAALIVKYRDASTDAQTALEEALR